MAIINIGKHKDFFIEIEEVHNEILSELSYVVTWPDGSKFVMAFDVDLGRLEVQGQAPYEAHELAEIIDAAIDGHNNGFTWI